MLCNFLESNISLIDSHYLLLGGYDGTSRFDTIHSFDKAEESWKPAGRMAVPRSEPAVQVIGDVAKHCQEAKRQKKPESNSNQSRQFPANHPTTHPPVTTNPPPTKT